MRTLLVAAFLLNILGGCREKTILQSDGSSPSPPHQPAIYPVLSLETVDADFEQATAKGDYRFIGLIGAGVYLPGVPTNFSTAGYGIRVILGPSHTPPGDEDKRFDKTARQYAEHYNKLLLKKIAP